MLSVRKGTTKRCCYGVCKSDTRYKSFKTNTYYFINFPKPCLEYRKKVINSSTKIHIKTCQKCSKCDSWVKKCGRSDRGFKSIDDVTKDTYICILSYGLIRITFLQNIKPFSFVNIWIDRYIIFYTNFYSGNNIYYSTYLFFIEYIFDLINYKI